MTDLEKFYKLALRIVNANTSMYPMEINYINGSIMSVCIDLGIYEYILFENDPEDEVMKIIYCNNNDDNYKIFYKCTENDVRSIDNIIYRLLQQHDYLVKDFFNGTTND